jgi:hypothetical protein
VGFSACDRTAGHDRGDRIVSELLAGTCQPDIKLPDAQQVAAWLARRYRAALQVGDELDLDEAMQSWRRQVELGAPVRVTVAGRVLVVVPERAAEHPALAAAGQLA